MMLPNNTKHELCQLLWVIADGSFLPEDIDRLEKLTNENPECRHLAAQFVAMYSMLHWTRCCSQVSNIDCGSITAFTPHSAAPSGFLHTTFHGTLGYLCSDWLVSYLVAAVIFAVGSLITSHIYVFPHEQIANNSSSAAPVSVPMVVQPERKRIAQVTGLVNCRWNDSRTAAYLGHCVAAGDEFALTSGLIEITYDTGAKVLLQGPVTYQVDSPRGGFLSVGKLTARVEKKGTRDQESSPKSPIPNSPLFAVRTPTAIVTDLGTEFGVEVKGDSETQLHVFRGSVQLQRTGVTAGQESPNNTTILHANEAASIKIQHGNGAKENKLVISRGQFDTTAFVRRLPKLKRVRIPTFNTGINTAEGKPDPHWRVVARSDDPKFKPCPAVVTVAAPSWYMNDIKLAQWISLDSLNGVARQLPNWVTYTFQTQFNLVDVLPDTAVMDSWFVVDNHIRAIRLNGKKVVVPEFPNDARAFNTFHSFSITEGFVAGTNVLEIDVENGGEGDIKNHVLIGEMGLRLELDGWAQAIENE
jgi:hypothetical protein